MKQKTLSFALGLTCAMGGLSVQAYDAVLNQKDSSATGLSCFTNAASWTPAGLPEAGKTYYSEMAMMSPPGTTAFDENGIGTFPGALYLKKSAKDSQVNIYANGYTWFKGGLHLLNTAYLRMNNQVSHIKGDIYCDENPNYMSIGNASADVDAYWDDVNLKGAQRLCIVTEGLPGSTKTIHWDGSADDFAATTVLLADTSNGRLILEFAQPMQFPTVTSFTLRNGVVLRPRNAEQSSTFRHLKLDRTAATGFASELDPVDGATLAVNGTLELAANADFPALYHVPTNGTVTAQTLKITAGVTLVSTYNGAADSTRHPFEVSNTLTLPTGKVPVRIDYAAGTTTGPGEVQVLKVPTSVRTISVENFEVVPGVVADIRAGFRVPTVTNMMVKVEDGMQTLCLYPRDLVRMTAAETSKSIVSQSSCWSDGTTPHAGADYYAGFNSRIYGTFPADSSLSFDRVVQATGSLVADDLRLAAIQFQSYGGLDWSGRAYLLPSTDSTMNVLVYSSDYTSFPLSVEFSGPGNFWVMYRGAKTEALWGGNVYLTGLNTNWTGKLLLACQGYSNPSAYPNDYKYDDGVYNATLFIEDERNLGGRLSEFTYDALRIRDWNVLAVTNEVTLSDGMNRGIYFDTQARVNVAAQTTLAVKRQVTYNGQVRKEGEGTLAVGVTPKFGTAQRDTPAAGENKFDVLAGGIQPLTATAFDGLAVAFSNQTAIVLAADATDADLVSLGMKNTTWATPFTWPETGTVDVKFTLRDSDGWATFPKTQLGVLTVADEATARAALAKLHGVNPQKNLGVKLTVRANADGTATVVATLAQSGCVVIFR
ncbi:MAG: hypothetical protein Q4G65_13370 [bacterium]|nr:hypothetical protein [bacterium]